MDVRCRYSIFYSFGITEDNKAMVLVIARDDYYDAIVDIGIVN